MKITAGPDLSFERAILAGPACGVDEAGRGPWAGPVCAGAVILDFTQVPVGLNDSKKLTARARDALEPQIKASALAWGVGFATVEEIDHLNILQATGLAMCRAIRTGSGIGSFAAFSAQPGVGDKGARRSPPRTTRGCPVSPTARRP